MIPENPQPDRLDDFLANVMSDRELETVLGVAIVTLTDLRSQRKGPAYVEAGRKIWYLRDRVTERLLDQVRETNYGNPEPRREVALPLQLRRKRVRGNNRLGAIKQNESRAREVEFEFRQTLREGKRPTHKIIVRQFNHAAKEFLEWAEGHYTEHSNSYNRVATSFTSLKEFFGNEAVSLVDEARIEGYKTRRTKDHKVRLVTLRHVLHALSKFFSYAIKQHWTRENPVKGVDISSDADAVRMHVLGLAEEKDYFTPVAKNKNLYDAGRLLLNQGMRPDEPLCVAKSDLDIECGTLYIRFGKTPAARRTSNLTSESRLILGRRMVGPSPWAFPRSKRHPERHIKRLNSAHERLLVKVKKEGVEFLFVPYDFRHTFATGWPTQEST
ncbi:MAG TPA: site-specific integrase [Terriglobales bacterium]|nr:site-specific integrase [Terriglobales bacterium]